MQVGIWQVNKILVWWRRWKQKQVSVQLGEQAGVQAVTQMVIQMGVWQVNKILVWDRRWKQKQVSVQLDIQTGLQAVVQTGL